MSQNNKIKYRFYGLKQFFLVLFFCLLIGSKAGSQNVKDTLTQIDDKLKITKINLGIRNAEVVEFPKYASVKKVETVKELLFEIDKNLHQLENVGYPFAMFQLDSLLADSNGLFINLNLIPGPVIYFDSIDLGGTAKITKAFLHQYLGIKINEPYNEKLIRLIDARISELPYLKITRPSGVYFAGNKAKPYIYLENKKASSFDGIIGFAPNSQLNNKLVLTGDVNLKLMNLAGSGKNLGLSFKSFLSGSQDLQVQFFWPYLLKSKLGLDYTFKLLRFDSTYLELFNDIGLQYAINGSNYVKLFYQQQQVNMLSADTLYVRQTGKLPNFSDVKTSYYGIGLKLVKLDYGLNPRRGYSLEFDLATGFKRIIENNAIKEIRFQNKEGLEYGIYDSLQKSSLQYKTNLQASLYVPISKNWVWVNQLKSGWVYNSQLFLNELYRIGGIKTLKGFDEQSIFASTFAMINVEMKYLFQQNSGFLLFANGAYYENRVGPKPISDWPWGFGAGMNLETGAGLFSLYYALGSQKGNPLVWRNAKIHFGLLNFF